MYTIIMINSNRLFSTFVSFVVLCWTPLFSDIQNEGILGAPFYTTNYDESGNIQNQVGPFAEFAVSSGLTAQSEVTTLLAGEKSQLSATLRLDDGTLTRLPATGVTWSSTSTNISIADNFVTAKEISRNTRVSISANGEGFNAVVFIRLKAGSPIVDSGSNTNTPNTPNALSQSTDHAQAGWKNSQWFGSYYDAGNQWIHHVDHGWLFTSSSSENSIWLWSPKEEWLWTGPGVYPHLFRNKDSTWLYFVLKSATGSVYYNHSTKSFEQ
jgi:hypothetical protein